MSISPVQFSAQNSVLEPASAAGPPSCQSPAAVPLGERGAWGARGYLKLYVGPMFSQKTQTLLLDLEMFVRSNCRAVYVSHADDVREDAARVGAVSTHREGFDRLPPGVRNLSLAALAELPAAELADADVIGVDECQFFPDLRDVVARWVNVEGKHVICAGLDGDSFMRPFGQTLDLVPLSDEVRKLRARCTLCRAELERRGYGGDPLAIAAPFSLRLVGGAEQKLVGGSTMYTAVCRYHHLSSAKSE